MRRGLFFLAVLGWWCSPASAGPRWPGFRGPSGDGHAAEATGLPVSWSETENVVWKTPVEGKAWSSPVVWDEQVWLTNAPPDGKQLFAVGLDFATGKVLHNIKLWEISEPQFCIPRNSYASPTPVIEAGRLYVHFGVHGTACVDTSSGKVLWERQDLPCNHHRGPASSPIVWENLLILTFDGYDQQYLVALDKTNGKTVWKTDRNLVYKSNDGDIKKAYGTPTVIDVGGQAQLISPSASWGVAYDPRSGQELWRVACGGMNVSSRPLFGHGVVYLTTADGGLGLYTVRPEGRGDVSSTHLAWKSTKGVPKYASLLLVGDLLYTGTEGGVLSALDAKTGDVVWQERAGKSFTPSPVFADGKLYFQDEAGSAAVLAPGREYKVLATNKLDGEFMASPAVAGSSLVLRSKTHLYRLEKR